MSEYDKKANSKPDKSHFEPFNIYTDHNRLVTTTNDGPDLLPSQKIHKYTGNTSSFFNNPGKPVKVSQSVFKHSMSNQSSFRNLHSVNKASQAVEKDAKTKYLGRKNSHQIMRNSKSNLLEHAYKNPLTNQKQSIATVGSFDP